MLAGSSRYNQSLSQSKENKQGALKSVKKHKSLEKVIEVPNELLN